MPPRTTTQSRCASCGKTFKVTLAEHYRQVHQQECGIAFLGEEDVRIKCTRGSDQNWPCPRCNTRFSGSSRRIQDHARLGRCIPQKSDCIEETYNYDSIASESEYQSSSSGHEDEGEIIPEGAYMLQPDAKQKPQHSSHSRSTRSARAGPSANSAGFVSSNAAIAGLAQLPAPTGMKPKEFNAEISASQLVKLQTATSKRPLSPAEHPQAPSEPRPSKRLALAKSDPSPHGVSHPSSPPAHTPSRHPRPPARRLSSAGPSRSRSISSTQEPPVASSAIPLPLQAFFDTTCASLDRLAPIFVANGFDSDETLDLLCELPPEGNWEEMKTEIMKKGRLAGWLAIQKGLQQRARALQAQRTSSKRFLAVIPQVDSDNSAILV